MTGVVRWLVWWSALFGFWLLLAADTDPQEMLVGAAAAAVGATAAGAIRVRTGARHRSRLRWLSGVPRALWQLPVDTVVLTAALLRHLLGGPALRGHFARVGFRTGPHGDDDGVRRALAVELDSFGPNTYVVGVDAEAREMLIHRLVGPGTAPAVDPAGLR